MSLKHRVAIVIVSDRAARGEREDRCTEVIREKLNDLPFEIVDVSIIPDDREVIAETLTMLADNFVADIILTSGGTGLGPRDVTPEATLAVADREVPGMAEAIRAYSLQITKRAMLSRGVAAMRKLTLIVNLPGSPKAVAESLDAFADQLEHAMAMISGGDH